MPLFTSSVLNSCCSLHRYTALHGKFLEHPLDKRRIPIILDAELVDMAFGTGAVKITPAHDPNDFASGQRHKLATINLFTDDGCINENGGKFAGQPRFQACMQSEAISKTERMASLIQLMLCRPERRWWPG